MRGDFPVTLGAYMDSTHVRATGFVTKLSAQGDSMTFSTYFPNSDRMPRYDRMRPSTWWVMLKCLRNTRTRGRSRRTPSTRPTAVEMWISESRCCRQTDRTCSLLHFWEGWGTKR